MALVRFQTDHQPLSLMQSQWSTELNPLLKNPSLQNVVLKSVELANGTTVVNHKLGRLPQGWRIVDIDGAAQIYRSQDFNTLTLTLTSDAAVTVSLEVF